MSSATETPFARLLRVVANVEPLEVRAVFASFAVLLLPVGELFHPAAAARHHGHGLWREPSAGAVHRHLPRQLHRRAGVCRAWPPASAWRPSCPGSTASSPSPCWASISPSPRHANNRWIAAAFYVWLSTFNLLTISVFWSLMADIFSQHPGQAAVRLHRRGRHRRHHRRPGLYRAFVNAVGTNNLLLISAAGFVDHRLSGARAGSAKSASSPPTIRRRSRPAWITDWAAIRSTASCCCSGPAIC